MNVISTEINMRCAITRITGHIVIKSKPYPYHIFLQGTWFQKCFPTHANGWIRNRNTLPLTSVNCWGSEIPIEHAGKGRGNVKQRPVKLRKVNILRKGQFPDQQGKKEQIFTALSNKKSFLKIQKIAIKQCFAKPVKLVHLYTKFLLWQATTSWLTITT